VSKWENGHTIPEYWLIFALCFVNNPNPWVIRMANEIHKIMNK